MKKAKSQRGADRRALERRLLKTLREANLFYDAAGKLPDAVQVELWGLERSRRRL